MYFCATLKQSTNHFAAQVGLTGDLVVSPSSLPAREWMDFFYGTAAVSVCLDPRFADATIARWISQIEESFLREPFADLTSDEMAQIEAGYEAAKAEAHAR